MKWGILLLCLLFFAVANAQQTVELCPGNRTTFTYYSGSNVFGNWHWVVGPDTVSHNSSVTLSWTTTGDFQIFAYFDNGCPVPPKVYTVHVIECVESAIYFPNAFTPNQDRHNEMWGPKGIGIETIDWMIFDRWGEMIYESHSLDDWWDGYYLGRECQQDVYVYKATWKDVKGNIGQKYGHVVLIR